MLGALLLDWISDLDFPILHEIVVDLVRVSSNSFGENPCDFLGPVNLRHEPRSQAFKRFPGLDRMVERAREWSLAVPFLSAPERGKLADALSRQPARELIGENVERLMATVLKAATLLKKDKKWFDVKQPHRGVEVKSFQVDPPLGPGTFRDNVLKRLSEVATEKKGKRRLAKDVGNDLVSHFNAKVAADAKLKGIQGSHVMAVLMRTIDARMFAYWEEPLHFGKGSDYAWRWGGKNGTTLSGYKGPKCILRWFANQKQVFYRWEVPPGADLFEVEPVVTTTYTQGELERERRKNYETGYKDGYADGTAKRPAKF